MQAYIEISKAIEMERVELNSSDLRDIGEFTKENLIKWIDLRKYGQPLYSNVSEFHAVCGEIDIRWYPPPSYEEANKWGTPNNVSAEELESIIKEALRKN